MSKKIWRRAGGNLDALEQIQFADEETIQRIFNDNPDVIPVDDLGLSELMVVGREATLESGWADLLAVTRSGEILIIEFKNQGNAQARREVVGQLLDYGAALWKKCPSYDLFDKATAKPYFGSTYCKDRRLKDKLSLEAAAIEFFEFAAADEQSGTADDLARFKNGIEATLKNGDFVYVIVCPDIPVSARSIIEYLAVSKSIRMYGVEIEYFKKGETEIFVPRGIAFGVRSPTVSSEELKEGLIKLGPEYWDAYAEFAQEVESLGGHFKPYSNGMGVYLPFGSGEGANGALLWVDLRNPQQPLHVFSQGQIDYYSGPERDDLDWFTDETATVYRERLRAEFPELVDTLLSKRKYGAPATLRESATFAKYLLFALRFYKECLRGQRQVERTS